MVPEKQAIAALLMKLLPGDSNDLQQLRTAAQTVHLPVGQMVFRRGDPCQGYLLMVAGCVRVQVVSEGGRDVVLYRVNPGESCVITTSCLISHENYPAEGIVEEDATALVFSQSVFEHGLAISDVFRRFVFSNQGRRLSDLILRIEDVVFERLDSRLAKLLIEYSEAQQPIIQMTHQQLASELGTAREVVSRQLKVFEKTSAVVSSQHPA